MLPGAACISVQRDPRDTAVSMFLSYFDTDQIGWSVGFDTMRRVIEAQQRLIPRGFEVLGIDHVALAYEDLVEQPAEAAGGCLALLGLTMDDRVLAPEQNERTAVTLSAQQVRRPINRSSIGRWTNYAWAFDDRWEPLVREHARRRRAP